MQGIPRISPGKPGTELDASYVCAEGICTAGHVCTGSLKCSLPLWFAYASHLCQSLLQTAASQLLYMSTLEISHMLNACVCVCTCNCLIDSSRGPTSFQGLMDIPESLVNEEFPSFSNQTKGMIQGCMLTLNRSQMMEFIKDPRSGSCRLQIEVKTMLMRF